MIERPDVLFDNIINIFNELAKIEVSKIFRPESGSEEEVGDVD